MKAGDQKEERTRTAQGTNGEGGNNTPDRQGITTAAHPFRTKSLVFGLEGHEEKRDNNIELRDGEPLARSSLQQRDHVESDQLFAEETSASIARLVRDVERGLWGLQGRGVDDIAEWTETGEGFDLLAPAGFRHTHSSPVQYSTTSGGEDELPPPSDLDHVRRSSSTPSNSSAFRQISELSAGRFRNPSLGGTDNRSAFSRHKAPKFAVSNTRVRHSAFDPVPIHSAVDEYEETAIEVVDLKSSVVEEEHDGAKKPASNTIERVGAAARARKFFSDVRVRRRRIRGGRDNPALPSSAAATHNADPAKGDPSSDDMKVKAASKETGEYNDVMASRTSIRETDRAVAPGATNYKSGRVYHQIDSDTEEGYEHYQRVEATISFESPSTIPSPSYQRFVDTQETTGDDSRDVGDDTSWHPIRIQITMDQRRPRSTRTTPETLTSIGGVSPPVDSTANSPRTALSTVTSNTSGHTTQATSTSVTISSGGVTTLSVVTETDMEVMETNLAGGEGQTEQHQRQRRNMDRTDGSGSTPVYNALAGSPVSPRDGASLRMDRFFTLSRFRWNAPSANSASSSSDDHPSNPDWTSAENHRRDALHSRRNSKKKGSNNNCSPITMSSASGGQASSSSPVSRSEPPRFVSYLERQDITEPAKTSRLSHTSTISSRPVYLKPEIDDRESPAKIVEYPQVVFEEATLKSERPRLVRPLKQKRDNTTIGSRPPLSPMNGRQTPTTPSPLFNGNSSPSFRQMSPPNIVENANHPGLSKPHVLRSAPVGAIGNSGAFRAQHENLDVRRGATQLGWIRTSPEMLRNVEASHAYSESSMEIENAKTSSWIDANTDCVSSQ